MKRQIISRLVLCEIEEKNNYRPPNIFNFDGLTDSEIDDTRKLLNAIQQEVPLLDSCLVKSILCIGAIGFQHSSHFIDLAMQLPCCNEPR